MANILVADDDESIRRLLDASFSRDGHQVVLAKDGEEAISLILNSPFDLVVLDYQMPFQNGPQVLSHIKNENVPIPPTLMLTAQGYPEIVQECIEAGAKDFVVKPFQLPSLVERAYKLLERSQEKQEPSED